MLANIALNSSKKAARSCGPFSSALCVAVAVVVERAFWWWRESMKRDPQKLEAILAALENSDFDAAAKISENSEDPIIRMIHRGLNHVHTSMEGALQLAAGIELERAGRFLTVMDTLVTLAPLLGLLGTVTGLMGAFLHLGTAELSVSVVTGGIGEALIATACGLGIAIFHSSRSIISMAAWPGSISNSKPPPPMSRSWSTPRKSPHETPVPGPTPPFAHRNHPAD